MRNLGWNPWGKPITVSRIRLVRSLPPRHWHRFDRKVQQIKAKSVTKVCYSYLKIGSFWLRRGRYIVRTSERYYRIKCITDFHITKYLDFHPAQPSSQYRTSVCRDQNLVSATYWRSIRALLFLITNMFAYTLNNFHINYHLGLSTLLAMFRFLSEHVSLKPYAAT